MFGRSGREGVHRAAIFGTDLGFSTISDDLNLSVALKHKCRVGQDEVLEVAHCLSEDSEELRELRWDHVFLEPTSVGGVELPPYIAVWRSVRTDGETKTAKSRRTIALPELCIEALRREQQLQDADRVSAGPKWIDTGVVFTTQVGTAMAAANVRRNFRRALRKVPGIHADDWTPRELRHSFVSMLSDMGLEVDKIAQLVGHTGGSKVTEVVYRHQLRPVLQTGALAFDQRFKRVG